MNPILFSLLAEGEQAHLNLEKARHAEEMAKMVVESAKAALENAKAVTVVDLASVTDIYARAESTGIPKKSFRALVEDRVTALINSGLVDLNDMAAPTVSVALQKPRQTRGKKEALEVAHDTSTDNFPVVVDNGVSLPQEAESISMVAGTHLHTHEDEVAHKQEPLIAEHTELPEVASESSTNSVTESSPASVTEIQKEETTQTVKEEHAPEPVVAAPVPAPAKPSFLMKRNPV